MELKACLFFLILCFPCFSYVINVINCVNIAVPLGDVMWQSVSTAGRSRLSFWVGGTMDAVGSGRQQDKIILLKKSPSV